MASDDRRTDSSVKDYGWGKKDTTLEGWLFAEGHRFDFFQAVRLLETIRAVDEQRQLRENGNSDPQSKAAPRRAPGESVDPKKEIVRFRSSVTLDFPVSDIAEVNLDDATPRNPVDHLRSDDATRAMVKSFKTQSRLKGAR